LIDRQGLQNRKLTHEFCLRYSLGGQPNGLFGIATRPGETFAQVRDQGGDIGERAPPVSLDSTKAIGLDVQLMLGRLKQRLSTRRDQWEPEVSPVIQQKTEAIATSWG